MIFTEMTYKDIKNLLSSVKFKIRKFDKYDLESHTPLNGCIENYFNSKTLDISDLKTICLHFMLRDDINLNIGINFFEEVYEKLKDFCKSNSISEEYILIILPEEKNCFLLDQCYVDDVLYNCQEELLKYKNKKFEFDFSSLKDCTPKQVFYI